MKQGKKVRLVSGFDRSLGLPPGEVYTVAFEHGQGLIRLREVSDVLFMEAHLIEVK